MTFDEVLRKSKGRPFARRAWNRGVKEPLSIMLRNRLFISYLNGQTGYWIPTGDELIAEDWYVVEYKGK